MWRFRSNKVSISLILLFVFQISAACDQPVTKIGHPNLENSEEVNIYQHSGLEKYNSPIDIHMARETDKGMEDLLNVLPGETLEDNRWTRLYEQVLGIEVKYDWTAKGNLYYQKLGTALASGNLPDVVKVNAQQLRELSNSGLIQDLTTVYENYATPFTKGVISQEGTGPYETAIIEGKLMGIPEVGSSIESTQFLWIRTDWMERLGLDLPKNMEDVLDISKAFTKDDPDQNGEDDTFGLAITQHLWDPVMGLNGFMAGYKAYPNIWIEDGSGRLVYGGIQPEVKTALKVLQEMYRKGQLDSEFGFKDGNKVSKLVATGKIGMFYGEQWGSFLAGSSRYDDSNAQWQAYPIVSESEELPRVPLRFATNRFFVVRKGFDHPEAIIKMINLHLEKNWGETSEYDTYYSTPFPVWKLSPVTPFPALKNLEAYRQLENARLTGDISLLTPEAKSIKENIDNYLKKGHDSGWGWERTYGPNGAFAILDQYVKNDQLLYDYFVGAPTDTMTDMKQIMDDLMHDTFVNIILGRPIYEFDEFVENWNRMGGTKMTEEVNQWYSERDGMKE